MLAMLQHPDGTTKLKIHILDEIYYPEIQTQITEHLAKLACNIFLIDNILEILLHQRFASYQKPRKHNVTLPNGNCLMKHI